MHCCTHMTENLHRKDLCLIYVPKFRSYGILYENTDSMQTILYCPWCGTMLPTII